MISFKLPEKVKDSLYRSYPEIKETMDSYINDDFPTYNNFIDFASAIHTAYKAAGFESKDILPWVTDEEFIAFMTRVHGTQKVKAALMLTEFRATSVTSKDFEEFLKRNESTHSIPFEEECLEQIEKGITSVREEARAVKQRIDEEENGRDRSTYSPDMEMFEQVKKIPQLNTYIESRIQRKYNTSAVSSMDLLEAVIQDSKLRVDVYKRPVYALAVQLEEDWIEPYVKQCLHNWETDESVQSTIDAYLTEQGAKDPEAFEAGRRHLLSLAPPALAQENSPDVYKLYKIIQLEAGKRDEVIQQKLLEDEEARRTYMASMYNSIERGDTPSMVAEQQATEDAYYEQCSRAGKGISGAVGTVAGAVVRLKYSVADNYESALRETLGKYSDNYDEDRERAKEKREQVKVQREQLEEARFKETQSVYGNPNIPYSDNAYTMRNQQYGHRNMNRRTRNAYNQNYGYNNGYGYGQYNTLGAQRMPMFIIAIIVHVLVTLVFALFKGWGGALIPAIGFILASIGWVQQRMGVRDFWKFLAGGYLLAILGIVFL